MALSALSLFPFTLSWGSFGIATLFPRLAGSDDLTTRRERAATLDPDRLPNSPGESSTESPYPGGLGP